MVSLINSWAQGIILAVIIASIIEIILPEGNNKKYVKTIIGIYIMFVIVQPLITNISNKKINFNTIIKDTTNKMNEYKTEDLAIETNEYIEDTYKDKLKEDISDKLKEKGYSTNSINLKIETENEEKYGEIKNINMQIVKNENEEVNNQNTINEIKSVEIKISDEPITEDIQNEEILEQEIEVLKEFLSNEYGIIKEYIFINE